MKGIVKATKGRIDPKCLVSDTLTNAGYSVSGCDLTSERVVVNLDHPSVPIDKSISRRDFLFIAETDGAATWVVPIELKSGGFDSKSVADQL